MKVQSDIVIIGGGPAGMACACAAISRDKNISVLIIERDDSLGGILNQCIHNGFGLQYFKEELTGPEYAQRFIKSVQDNNIRFMTDTMALSISDDGDRKTVIAVNKTSGMMEISSTAVVLAMGCRERSRGAINIPGDRPSGVITAGTAQRYMNIEGKTIGNRVVILGSGDIGLIMARRLALNGARVLACVEICSYPGGLNRNIVQCLNDFGIPLYLSSTITKIIGKHRVEAVEISQVDEMNKPVKGTQRILECDTVLLSVGLIPENELTRSAGISIDPNTGGPFVYENLQVSQNGIFACGNTLHVHDLVDSVTEESIRAGISASDYVKNKNRQGKVYVRQIKVTAGHGIRYTVPQIIRLYDKPEDVELSFRVAIPHGQCIIEVKDGEKTVASFKRLRAAPGEMEKILLTDSLLRSFVSDSLSVIINNVVDNKEQNK